MRFDGLFRYARGPLYCFVLSAATVLTAQDAPKKAVNLSTSKQLLLPAPGGAQRVNSLPMSMAVSPDGLWVVTLNAGYGTLESKYEQSLAVLDVKSGAVRDFPDSRTGLDAKQTFFSGLAFSADGKHLYASLASSGNPEGDGGKRTGSGVVVYGFSDGALTPQGFLKLPLVKLAAGHRTLLRDADGGTMGVPFPAAIAVLPGAPGAERLLVAENLSDSVAVLNATTGDIERRFDLSDSDIVPSTYPIALAVTKDGTRAFVALWNASEVVELDLANGKVARRLTLMKPTPDTAPGTHPCMLLLDERAETMYVALSNRDAVAAVDIGKGATPRLTVRGYFDTRLPGQSYFGAEPDALALNADGPPIWARIRSPCSIRGG